ncbi:hypothetical protein A8B78_10305 [Jannaschia sp. EhC01]|nr:hypothetical protein A8B78_10305 [Jannaschia sp. EhC01]
MGSKHKGLSEMMAQVPGTQADLRDRVDGRNQPDSTAKEVGEAPPFENALRAALDADRIADARTLVANAEAVLFAHEAAEASPSDRMTQAQLAAAKARIAIATGDGAAARAILVQAIERNPKTPALRTLMTEVMMAEGRATDVRPVLQHLGNDRSLGPDASDDVMPTSPTLKDTSG